MHFSATADFIGKSWAIKMTNLIVSESDFEPDFEGDYYDILGVDRKAKIDEIRAAYRRLAMKYHPDRNEGKTTKQFQLIQTAYECLADSKKREFYDNTGTPFASDAEIKDRANEIAVRRIMTVCDTMVTSGDPSMPIEKLALIDPVKTAVTTLVKDQNNLLNELTTLKLEVKRYDFILKRFSRKKTTFKQTVLGHHLQLKIAQLKRNQSLKTLALRINKEAILATSIYEYDVEKEEAFVPTEDSLEEANRKFLKILVFNIP